MLSLELSAGGAAGCGPSVHRSRLTFHVSRLPASRFPLPASRILLFTSHISRSPGTIAHSLRLSSPHVIWFKSGCLLVVTWFLLVRLTFAIWTTLVMATQTIFETVPKTDSLGFWANHQLNYRKVVDFLDLDSNDVGSRSRQLAPAAPVTFLTLLTGTVNIHDDKEKRSWY